LVLFKFDSPLLAGGESNNEVNTMVTMALCLSYWVRIVVNGTRRSDDVYRTNHPSVSPTPVQQTVVLFAC
jgi:hypothetical protein